ncbi:MAG: hypothetical protein ACLGIJ_13985 [Candidatus Limnocylindria bacterium]
MADHRGHDPLLAAAAAERGGSLPTTLAACGDCRSLATDLRALALALPASAIPARPRDLRLTVAAAARLRPRGWRRVVALVGSARDGVTRPLAVGLTTLGIVGLLMSAIPTVLPPGRDAAAGGPGIEALGDPPRSGDRPVDLMGDQGVVVPPAPTVAEPPSGGSRSEAAPADRSALRLLSMAFLGLAGALVVRRRVRLAGRLR